MIDTHLHILPGVDDGPETIEEALALAKALVQEGVHTAIATPHYNDQFAHLSMAEIRRRVDDLQQELVRHSIPLRIFPGHEALISPGLVEDIRTGKLATLNGSRYLLLELWNNAWMPQTEQVIFELRALGVVPIIAHPERYRIIQKNPTHLASLLKQGALAQLTVSSLIGMQGNTVRLFAENLVRKGLVHCIASDAHGLHRRPPGITRGLQRAAELLGHARVCQLIDTCPAAIINNEVCFV